MTGTGYFHTNERRGKTGDDRFAVPSAERTQVVESEDDPEFDGAGLDGGDVGVDDDVSGVEPDSLFAGGFSDPLPAPSLAWLSLCFAWLGSFILFE